MKRTPVTIRGVKYPSQSEAARCLGVRQPVICNAMRTGTLDNVGLRKQRNKYRSENYSDSNPLAHPIKFGGVQYSSMRQAARKNDISPNVFRYHWNRGNVEHLLQLAMGEE